jgi:hypothetical protein
MGKVRILPALGNMFGIGGGGYDVGWIGFLWGRFAYFGVLQVRYKSS